MVGTTGEYFGPAMMGWLRQATGTFEAGLMAMAGIMVAATVLSASLWMVMGRE